jgi:hypothetical protein
MNYYAFINAKLHIFIMLTVYALPINFLTGFKFYQLVILSLFFSVLALFVLKLVSNERFGIGLMKSINLYLCSTFICIGFISGVFQNGFRDALLGSIEYLAIFGLFLFLAFLNFPFSRYLHGLIVHLSIAAIVIGFLGIYQYFIDFDLFGLYSDTGFSNIELWTIKRVPSILGSIQVFSAFMTYVILLLYIFKPFRDKINTIIILLLMGLGSVSGSFLYFGSILLILLGLIARNLITLITVIFICGFICLTVIINLENIELTYGPLLRLISIFNPVGEFNASNSARVSRWLDAVQQTPIFYGNGFGRASMLVEGPDRFNTESYLFSTYYQTGILGSFIIFVLFISLVVSATRGLPLFPKLIVLSIVGVYMLGVHVFHSIMMSPLWLLLIQTKGVVDRREDFSSSLQSSPTLLGSPVRTRGASPERSHARRVDYD